MLRSATSPRCWSTTESSACPMSRATNSPGIVTRANILQALASATKKLPSLTTPDNCELRKKVASPASRRAVASDDAHGHGSRRHVDLWGLVHSIEQKKAPD